MYQGQEPPPSSSSSPASGCTRADAPRPRAARSWAKGPPSAGAAAARPSPAAADTARMASWSLAQVTPKLLSSSSSAERARSFLASSAAPAAGACSSSASCAAFAPSRSTSRRDLHQRCTMSGVAAAGTTTEWPTSSRKASACAWSSARSRPVSTRNWMLSASRCMAPGCARDTARSRSAVSRACARAATSARLSLERLPGGCAAALLSFGTREAPSPAPAAAACASASAASAPASLSAPSSAEFITQAQTPT
mmetsp:Transcript_9704/g.28438  ORF Transcript_9704/g.28438 Transcript_9704/m.28438 type:complete len:253 (+) Transcript_9704:817-1575(+)